MKYCALNNGFYRDNTPDDKIPGNVVHISDDEGKRILDSQINGRIDAPRDKCTHFREINGIAAAFQHLQKNYNPTASSFL